MSTQVGLLVDSLAVQEWERRAIQSMLQDADTDVEITLVVVNDADTSRGRRIGRVRRFISDFSLWKCFVAVRILRQKVGSLPWYRERTSLDQIIDLETVSIVMGKPQPNDGIGHRLPQTVIESLKEVDVAVRFGFGIIVGKALTAPEQGILSYHHGDLTEYRGQPAGLYEFIHGRRTAGVTVQRLNNSLDAGELAAVTDCDISDAQSLREVQSRLFEASPRLLAEAVDNCMNKENISEPESLGRLYTTPDTTTTLLYLKRRAALLFR
jgi:folate-dependent phosphoribosylglycinamide formyltransferase PurN